MQSGGAWVV